MTPTPRQTPDVWAAENRAYPAGAAIPGKRDPYLTPYMVQIERLAVAGTHKRIVVVTSAQSAKTEMLLDVAGQRLDQAPAPILYVGPNKQFLTEQFEPRVMALLDEAASLRGKVARGKRMTKTRKVIAGVPFRLAHAGSSAALKSDPAALALIDEYDEMLANVKGQGDPLGLVERRGDTYPDFMAIVTSTPRRGMVQMKRDEHSGLHFWEMAPPEDIFESPIWRLWQSGSRHHWSWPCPHCREYFIPNFDMLRWPEGATPIQASRATHVQCDHCGGVIEEKHKVVMNARGKYVAPGQSVTVDGVVMGDPPDTATLSFWVSGLCSPFVTFGERVQAYLEAVAMGDDASIQTAVNGGFGELYSPGGRDVKEWQQVAKRRQPYRFGQVDARVLKLTAAVDVSKRGLWYSVRGWGERATSWQIETGELAGYTNEPEVWGDLANVLLATYGGLPVSLAMIDSGFRPNKQDEGPTNIVYEFCNRFRRMCRPTKGYDTLAAPIMRGKSKVAVPGRGLQVSLELVRLDTDFWKSRLHERLTWKVDAPGGFWLSQDATEDYCKQLVSEVRKIAPSGKPEWVTVSRRNHYFDVEAMNEAAGHMLGAQKIPLGTRRTVFEDANAPELPLEAAPLPLNETPVGPVAPPAHKIPPKTTSLRGRMSSIASRLNR